MRIKTHRGRTGRHGFNMIELIMAITISMIALVIGFSGFHIYKKRMPVESTAKRFKHTLSTCRSYAISRNSFYKVTLDLDEGSWWIDEEFNPNLPPGHPNETRPRVKSVVPENIEDQIGVEIYYSEADFLAGTPVTTGIAKILFAPDGSTINGSGALGVPVRVVFHHMSEDPNVAQNSYMVRIYEPTGMSEVFENERF